MLHKTICRTLTRAHSDEEGVPWWVWPLSGAAVLGLLVWWLRGRHQQEPEVYRPRYIPLKGTAGVRKPQEAAPAGETPAAKEEPDDLKRIEGIGPKIAELLQEQGIYTYAQLAAADESHLQEILAAARLQHLAQPATWPEQATLAARGDWDGLQAMQDRLKGGKRD